MNVNFYAQFISVRVPKTGLTDVKVTIWRIDGQALEVVVSQQAAIEVGNGIYRYQVEDADPTLDYIGVFHANNADVDQTDVPVAVAAVPVGALGDAVLDAAILDHDTPGSVAALLSLLAGIDQRTLEGVNVTVIDPVLEGGTVRTIQGDTYRAAQGRAIAWRTGGAAPDLTAAAIAIIIDGEIEITGEVVAAYGDNQAVRCQPTAAQTAAISAAHNGMVAKHLYNVAATWDDDPTTVVTIIRGIWESESRSVAP